MLNLHNMLGMTDTAAPTLPEAAERPDTSETAGQIAEAGTREEWQENLRKLGEAEGFYRALGDQHTALFCQRGKTLVVTFDNLDHVYERSDDRLPWGYGFTQANGWSMLGLMAHDWTWYRDAAVWDFFDELRDSGFFKQFDRVVFYGASMGAYAACAFSAAHPGADVICISPQATLARDLTSWETRYHKAWRRDFHDRYGYAPDMVATARKVTLFFDPTAPLDAMHAALFQGDNIDKVHCRYMGHRIASLWAAMGVLRPIVEGCVNGTISRRDIYRLLRARHETPRYQKEMLRRLKDRGRHDLLVRYCRGVLATRRAPVFRREMNASLKVLGRKP